MMNLIFKAIELAFAIIAFIGALGLGFIGILLILAIVSWMIGEITGGNKHNERR